MDVKKILILDHQTGVVQSHCCHQIGHSLMINRFLKLKHEKVFHQLTSNAEVYVVTI